MRCVAESVLDGYALLQPTHGFKTNVYCYAKRSLRKGDALDGLGGYACYGLIENCKDNQERPGFPICLAEDVTVTRDIMKDEKYTPMMLTTIHNAPISAFILWQSSASQRDYILHVLNR